MDNAALPGLETEGKRRARERRKKQKQMEEYMQKATIRAALMSECFPFTSLSENQITKPQKKLEKTANSHIFL